MRSPKETSLDKKLLDSVSGEARRAAEALIADEEVQALQEYANVVSIRRLNYNDHGPVHMRKVALNAMLMLDLLAAGGVKTSLETDGAGTVEDSRVAVLLAAFLHDVGMSVGRQHHETNSAILSEPIISRLLADLYPRDVMRRTAIKCLAIEGIEGHMATQRIHSIEAGLILVADGCDMEKGRSRIPMMLSIEPRVGDIHQYSAAAITKVDIGPGEHRPIRISIAMRESVGFFQVEEVLLQKVNMSPVKPQIELLAAVEGQAPRRYLG
ncbi:MAG: phosphohydrolase [Spirochaetes bacterium]|nr:phosphohydrolase [Spirochaetota bacterium]MBU1080629.1 phosphohydrolase [Spirochaetota bacterium]